MSNNASFTPVIALIEDEPLTLLVLESALEEAGFQVRSASNAKAAIALLEHELRACKVVVTDIRLARDSLTGWDIAQLARELNPSISVVYITGDSAPDWPVRGVPNSVLIQKPFDPRAVISAVSQLLGSNQ